MTVIRSLEDLNRYKEKVLEKKAHDAKLGIVQVVVGLGSCGIAAGALATLHAIQDQVDAERIQNVLVSQTGCCGQCKYEPIVYVMRGEHEKVTYGKVTPEVARRILKEHILGGKVVQEHLLEAY